MKIGVLVPDLSPQPDLRTFVSGRTDAIAWRADRPSVSQAPGSWERAPNRPDLSRFVDGPASAIAWAWDEPDLADDDDEVIDTMPSVALRAEDHIQALLVGAPVVSGVETELQNHGLCAADAFAVLSLPQEPDQPFTPPPPALDEECGREWRKYEKNTPRCPAPPVATRISTESDCDCSYDMLYFTTDSEVHLQDKEYYKAFFPGERRPNPVILGYAISNDTPTDDEKGEPLPNSNDVRFLLAIWNFLLENIDIVEWVVCLTEGPRNARCVVERLLGERKQKIKLDNNLPFGCPKDSVACTASVGSKISIDITSDRWVNYRSIYLNRMGEDTDDALCAVAFWSATLLHELLHACLSIFNEQMDDSTFLSEVSRGTGCGCDSTDMVQSSFVWAIAQRYPCVLSSEGCAFLSRDCVWMTTCSSVYGNSPCTCDDPKYIGDDPCNDKEDQ